MDSILNQILLKKVNSHIDYLSSLVSKEDIDNLINITNGIKKDKLYQSPIHGLYHSEKVMLFSYLIGKDLNLNDVDFQILMDAALYHDISRENDYEDAFHGMVSANRIDNVVDSPIYKDETNLKLLKAIIDIHSQNDNHERVNFDNYEIGETEYDRYKILYSILKDADALDRTRFNEICQARLDPNFLRFDYSKTLIDLSQEINNLYYEVIEQRQQVHQIDKTKAGSCFHGIGFDFFKLNSVLTYGILSASAMDKLNLSIPRNFEGGNSKNWISVVDASLIHKNFSGYRNFTKHGINFFCEAPEIIEPMEGKNKYQAILEGLPYNKSNHLDERYVYDKIPVENITGVLVPETYLNKDISELSYLYNSLNFQLFLSRIKYFADRFSSEDIKLFDNEYEKENFEELLAKYKMSVDKYTFSQHSDEDQDIVLEELTAILIPINVYIQKAMKLYYQKELNKDSVTVLDVVKHEMIKSGIDYDYCHSDSTEALFILKGIKQTKTSENEKYK